MCPREIFHEWYGEPLTSIDEDFKPQINLIGFDPQFLPVIGKFLSRGTSVAFFPSLQKVYYFIPHPANREISNERFFEEIKKIAKESKISYEIPEKEPEKWVERGALLYGFGWKLEGVECFLRALFLDPNLSSAWAQMARYFLETKETNLAKSLLEIALELNENDPEAVLFMGIIYFRKKKFEEAEKYLKKALELVPDDFFVNFYLGLTLFEKGKEKEDFSLIRKAYRHLLSASRIYIFNPALWERCSSEVLENYIRECQIILGER